MPRSQKRTSEPEHTMSHLYSDNAHVGAKYLSVGRIVWVGWFLCKSWHIPGQTLRESRNRYIADKTHHKVYGCLSLKVTRIVPRVCCVAAFVTGALFSSSETPYISFSGSITSSTSSSSLPESIFFRLRAALEEPCLSKGAADLKKPRSSSWLLRMFLSWSVIPFPT